MAADTEPATTRLRQLGMGSAALGETKGTALTIAVCKHLYLTPKDLSRYTRAHP
jgi:hypothetical protein